jgi:hypothetical protein
MKQFIDPPALVQPAQDLAGFFAEANAEHEAGQRAERASLEHYRKAGAALLKAKAAAGHGNWLQVLKAHGKIAQQRASEYMRLAEGWAKLPPGGNFALKEALRVIAGEDEETEEQIVARLHERLGLLQRGNREFLDRYEELRRRGYTHQLIAGEFGISSRELSGRVDLARDFERATEA